MRSFLAMCLVSLSVQAAEPEAVKLSLDDQFAKAQNLSDYKGQIVVLVYGDRKATDACAKLGETLHVAFHPDAKGLPADKARKAAVLPLNGMPAGKASPEVTVVPVACMGKIPDAVKTVIRTQVKKASPEVPVWMDSADTMVTKFGMTTGEPNVVVFDAQGRLRHTVNGTMNQDAMNKLAGVIQTLRVEAVK